MVPAKVTVKPSPSKESVRIDFDTTELIASLTIWFPIPDEHTPGMCDAEILDRDSEETTYYTHAEFKSNKELQSAVSKFLGELYAQSQRKHAEFTEWLWGDSFGMPSVAVESVKKQDMVNKVMAVVSSN